MKFQDRLSIDGLDFAPVSASSSQSLSDAQKNLARNNIDVYSKSEVNQSINSISNSIGGSIYSAAKALGADPDNTENTKFPIVGVPENTHSASPVTGKYLEGVYFKNGKLYSNNTEVATQTDISTVTAVAEGKTKAYVTNKTKMSALNSLDDTVTISSFTDLNNTTVALSNFKVGDIVYLTDTEIPNRWVSTINTTTSNNVTTVTGLVLSKMETSKVPLSDYVPTSRTIAGVDLQDDITKAELQKALGFTGANFYSGNKDNYGHDANTIINNGVYYWNSNGPSISDGMLYPDGGLYVLSYSNNWAGQIAQDYRNGRIFVRGKNNGSWTAWTRIANYNEIPTNTVSSTTITAIQVVSSMPASPDSNTLYIVQ